MDFTRTPAFTLQRSNSKMKFQVKSIIVGLSIILLILLVYICTLPSTQPQDTNNLRWLQNIIDENKKKKIAMQSLYKPKSDIFHPNVHNHPFLLRTTSADPYQLAAVEQKQKHVSFQNNRFQDFGLPFNKFDTSSESTSTNWQLLQNDNQLLNKAVLKSRLGIVGSKLLGDVSSATTSSPSTRPITKYNHAGLKSQLWKFGLPLFSDDSSSSTTGSMTTSTSTTSIFDRMQPFFKQQNNYPLKNNIGPMMEPHSGYGLKQKNNEFNPQKPQPNMDRDKSFERQTIDKTKARLAGAYPTGVEDESKNKLLSAYKQIHTPGFLRENHAANKKIQENPTDQNIDKMVPKTKAEFAGISNFVDTGKSVLPRKKFEGLPAGKPDETFQHQKLNKAVPNVVLPGYKSESIGKISQTNYKPLIEKKGDTLGERLSNLKQKLGVQSNTVEKNDKMPFSRHTEGDLKTKPAEKVLNKNLIQRLDPSFRNRLNICKTNMPDKSKPPLCPPLQTLTGSVRICTHPTSKDPGVSQAIHNTASWEFTITRDVQIALLKDDSSGLIDIGAGIGVYSIIAASLGRQVIAVEPYQPHVRLFQKSIAMNKLTNYISLVCNAVSDVHETVKADPVPGDMTQVIWNYVPDKSDKTNKQNNNQAVKTITLDDLANIANFTSAVLKLDIPEYDSKVLKAAYKLFGKVNIMYVFMHWRGREKIDLQEIVKFFVGHHYHALDQLDGHEIDMEQLLHSDRNIVIWEKSKPKLKT